MMRECSKNLPMNRVSVFLIGTTLMLVPMLLNGSAFVYFDTASYLSRPDKAIGLLTEALSGTGPSSAEIATTNGRLEPSGSSSATHGDYIVGGRSVFYGLAVWAATAIGRPEVMAVIQAAATVAVLYAAWGLLPRSAEFRREGELVLVIGLLALITPAGFFAGLLMPDVFAPLVVLSVALLVCAWTELGRLVRWGLLLLLTFGLVAHTSHLLIAIGMLGTGVLLHLSMPSKRRFLSIPGLASCAGAAIAAIAALLSTDIAAERMTGVDVIPRPHLTAHLVDGGPGALWVARNCPNADETTLDDGQMAVCAFRDRIPTDWIAFLFSDAPERGAFQARDAAPDLRRALSDQDLAFALAVFRDDPAGTLRFMVGDFAEQLFSVRYDDVPLADRSFEDRVDAFPPEFAAAGGGRIASDPALLAGLSGVAEITAVAGAIALLIGCAVLCRTPILSEQAGTLLWVTGAVILGVVLNAAICGMLASPYDRFQSRVIFLIPAFAMVIWSAILRHSFLSQSIPLTRSESVTE